VRALSAVAARLAGLEPAQTQAVGVERDLAMTADDGVVLLADRWYPKDGSVPARLPIVLMRSPYGRRQMGAIARLFAERGYQVVVQSCRGTFGSGGELVPFRNERADGRRTLAWLAEQPWWSGTVATFGPSYLGLTQWSIAEDPPPTLRAMALDVTASQFRNSVVYPGGSFALQTGATWLYLLEHQERGLLRVLAAQARARARTAGAYTTLPLARAEAAALGRRVDYYQDWLEHERPGDPWWEPVDFARSVATCPPATLLGGWYDIFLPAQVDDYVALVGAGRRARLTIGPWTHASPGAAAAGIRDALEWFDGTLKGRRERLRELPVHLWVLGADRWVDLAGWPPPATTVRWHLHAGGRLAPVPAGPAPATRYRWDPADPTPSVGGPSLDASAAGPRDQAARERRPDVASFTSDVLARDLTVVGPLHAELWLRSSNWHTDLFVRLCDVDRSGVSRNLSDGILRMWPEGRSLRHGGTEVQGQVELHPDGVARVRIRMWPTAATLRSGHRVRLQVSGGAHPLFARNPGSGERLGEAATLVPAEHEVFHDPDHPSVVELPESPV
jgi:putative CocE/NonD family hydrolase